MSLEKTTTEGFRDFTYLEKYPVFEALPAYFEKEYPRLVSFLKAYYEQDTTISANILDLPYKRDFVAAQDDLLRLFSKELLLGRDYYDKFIDKQMAIQTSNLLYRSKGTHYSIQQFFRVFFGFDVDIRYGRDEVFLTGDPFKETLVYEGKKVDGYLYPGNRIRFNFDDGDTQVWALAQRPREEVVDELYMTNNVDPDTGLNVPYCEDPDDYVLPYWINFIYNVYYQLRQEIDYIIDYDDKSVVFQAHREEPVRDDPWINALARTGIIPEGAKVKLETNRYTPAGSAVGTETTEKMITNNGFFQLFALMIKTPISVVKWREAYKDFVHPAGMYLEGQVEITPVAKVLKKMPDVITEQYRKDVHASDELLEFVHNQMSELSLVKYNSPVPMTDSDWTDEPDYVIRSRINDLQNNVFTLEEWDRQYVSMERIDDIEPKRFDADNVDLSQQINTIDENMWVGKRGNLFCLDSDRKVQTVLGNQLDFAPEYAGCPGFVFGINRFNNLQVQYNQPKHMLRNPTYLPGDSDGFGGGPFPYGIDSDGAGNPILMSDGDFQLGSIRGIQYRTDPGPVAGLADASITAYRDMRVYGYWQVPRDSVTKLPIGYGDYVDPSNSTSEWAGDLDYANEFNYAEVSANVRVLRGYYQSPYNAESIDEGYWDSAYYYLRKDVGSGEYVDSAP